MWKGNSEGGEQEENCTKKKKRKDETEAYCDNGYEAVTFQNKIHDTTELDGSVNMTRENWTIWEETECKCSFEQGRSVCVCVW